MFSSSAPRRVALTGFSAPPALSPALWVRRGAVLCAGGPDEFVVVERSLRYLARSLASRFCVVFLVLGSAAVLGGV